MLLAPLRAVGDLPFYRGVAARNPPWLIGYLTYLGFLFSIAATVSMALKVTPILTETVDWAAGAIPQITFSGGKVSTASPEPVRVEHPRMPEIAIVIDTHRTTTVTAQEMRDQKLAVYLTQNALYLAPRPDKIESYDLSKIAGAPQQPTVLDAAFFRTVGQALPKILYPLTFFLSWTIFLLWKLFASLVYGVVALLINAGIGGGLEFPQLWRIALVAQTPVVFLQMAQMFLPQPIPLFGVIAWIVVGVYLWQGIKQNAPAAPAVPI
ncbi:MAG: DUF1189 family protein [Elusimicrobia bacterium]|nr:DUF1189 family protein [Elusimicrobiota bacterium]